VHPASNGARAGRAALAEVARCTMGLSLTLRASGV